MNIATLTFETTTAWADLASLRRRMRLAVDSGDWESLGRLDTDVRQLVGQVVAAERERKLQATDDLNPLREQLLGLLGFYRNLLDDCRSNRARAAKDMAQCRTGRAAVGAYAAAG